MGGPQSYANEGLELLDVGVAIFDKETRLIFANQAFHALRRYPDDLCREGVTLEALLRFNAERGDFGPGNADAQVAERLAEIHEAEKREIERQMADGQILGIKYRRTGSGGLVVIFQDRTAERRAEAALKASEERYALVSEAAEEAVYEWDIAAGRFFASPRLATLLGRDTGEHGVRQWVWKDLIHPDDLPVYQTALEAHLSGAQTRWNCEYRLKDASGAWRWVSDHGTSVRSEDGQAVRMVAAIHDITERVQKDAALAASEERHMLVSRATSDGIYDWNVTDDLLYVSDALNRLLDFDLGVKASSMWAERVHPEDLNRYVDTIRSHFRGETDAVECEYRVRGKGGVYRWIQDRGIGVRRKDGRVTRLVGAVRDVTEIREARAELDRTEARLMSSLATISDGILLVDAENRVQLWNDRYIEIFTEAVGGADLSEVIVKGRSFFDMIRDGYNLGMFKPHPDGADAWVEARIKAWDNPVSEWELELANGTWILLNEREMPDGGRVSVYTDITELKRREQEALASRERFEEAIEAISSGFALFDAEDRLVIWNSRFQEYFLEMADVFAPGVPFRDILAASAERGRVPGSEENQEQFLDDLMEKRAKGVGQIRENRLSDGLWLQIRDHRTKDGGLVSIYTDITDLKTSEQEAQAARERFEEAIEAISTGFALFDAEDRLVLWNSRFQQYFSKMEDVFTPGVPFRDMLAATIKRGLFPGAKEDPEGFLDALLEKRAKGVGEIRENMLNDGLWLQIRDHRTKDGGMVSIYTDVTELKTSEQEAKAAQQRFEDAIEAISAGFSLWDAEDRLVVCNSTYREFYSELADAVEPGVHIREVLQLAAQRGLLPAAEGDPEAYVEENIKKRAAGVGRLREHRLSTGRWLHITDHSTSAGGVVSIHTDVTELKTREEEIRQKSAILEATMENMGQGITMVDSDLRTVAFNKKFFELMGWPEEEFGRGFTMEEAFRYNAERGEYGPGDVEEQVRQRVELAKKFEPHRFERTRPDGTVLEIVGNPIEGGGLVATYTDITERKKADEALRAALEEFNAVIDSIDYGVLFMGPDLRARICNRAFGEIWGIPQDLIDRHPTMREMIEYNRDTGVYAVAPEDWDDWIDDRVEQIRQGDIPPGEFRRADGKVLRYQCVALPDGGRMLTYFDITELKQAEQVVRESEVRLRGILENSPIGVAVIGDDNIIRFHNSRFAEILGGAGQDLVGTKSNRFWTDLEERERSMEKLREEGRVREREVMYRGIDGSDVWSQSTYEKADWEGISARLVWIYDVTEEKANREALVVARDEAEAALAGLTKAQERLVQSEKMASLGQLTAGIAHEIKNPLNFVNNFAKLSDELLEELNGILAEPIKALDEDNRDDAEDLFQTVRENLGKINEHGKRADSIVKNMLLHSREGPSERQAANLNAIAEEALNLAYHGARAENPKFNIEMEKSLDEDVGEVECFPQDLMRVFLNLITNGMYAAHKRAAAAGDGFSPAISVSTRRGNGSIEVEVRDNGTGIPPEVRERIFMPFFTTKPAGEGTGLGLSLSYDIVVKQHGGELTVDSEPGEFTAFRVLLPPTLPASEGTRQ